MPSSRAVRFKWIVGRCMWSIVSLLPTSVSQPTSPKRATTAKSGLKSMLLIPQHVWVHTV